MNDRAAALHLAHTTFAEPAGVSLQTVSTPSDLVALGMAAMQQEVLAQIVGLAQTTLPVAGTAFKVNWGTGRSGVVVVKKRVKPGAKLLFSAGAPPGVHAG